MKIMKNLLNLDSRISRFSSGTFMKFYNYLVVHIVLQKLLQSGLLLQWRLMLERPDFPDTQVIGKICDSLVHINMILSTGGTAKDMVDLAQDLTIEVWTFMETKILSLLKDYHKWDIKRPSMIVICEAISTKLVKCVGWNKLIFLKLLVF